MALPQKIQVNAITGASLPSTIDGDLNAGIKQPLIDIFGIPDNTNVSAALTEVTASGLKNVRFQDAAGDPGTAGYLQRNAANLLFHDGTAARTLVSTVSTQTLTNKTISSPVFSGTSTGVFTLSGTTPGDLEIDDPVLDGTVTGIYTLAGTPTLTSPTINTATITGGTITSVTLTSPTLAGTPVFPDNVFTVGGSGDSSKKVAFEVDGLATATTRTMTVPNASGTLALTADIPMYMQGFTYANNAGDAVNDLDITAGACRDATNAHTLIGTALTKRSDATFVVGNNQGMLDTGAIGNNDYYLWVIKRSDTNVVDYLCSLSSTAPTMPTNYDFKRLIGWFKRVGGTIVAFTTYETEGGGLELLWAVPTLDINLSATLTTSRRTDAVKVPLNFSTFAHLNVILQDSSAEQQAWIYCPDQTDTAPSKTVAPLSNVTSQGTGNIVFPAQLKIRTSSAGLIAARSNLATVDAYLVSTIGFTWARRN